MSLDTPVLDVIDLRVGYGVVPVVYDVSLCIGRGQAIALLGANGAGKSTLLKGISGLVQPSHGQVVLQGEDVSRISVEALVRKGLSHVAEGRRIFRKATVRDNLLLGMSQMKFPREEGERRLTEVFELFPALATKARNLAGSLSGGQQQMLAIAQALVRKPAVIMLDEPSLGLAPILVEEVFQMLARIREQGVSILLVEQVVDRALEFVDYAYLIQNGRITSRGTPQELAGTDVIRRAYLGDAATE